MIQSLLFSATCLCSFKSRCYLNRQTHMLTVILTPSLRTLREGYANEGKLREESHVTNVVEKNLHTMLRKNNLGLSRLITIEVRFVSKMLPFGNS